MNVIKKLLTISMALLFLSTCTSFNTNIPVGYNYQTERAVRDLPRDSFMFVMVEEYYEHCFTPSTSDEKTCVTFKETGTFSGSAFVVHNTPNGSLVVTADHICQTSSPNMRQKMTLTTIDGKVYSAKIIERDSRRQNDICMVYSKKLKKPALKLALSGPPPGAKLFNIAAPAGIFNAGMVPIMEGRYNGLSFSGSAMYSIPAAGGSSGSMVLNNNFELVGLIHSLHVRFPTVTVGPPYSVLSKFVREGIKKHSNL
tara:strand:- start:3624 stop:4388 length:765 start_codon:yes stop_codon:yes gene_type:complete